MSGAKRENVSAERKKRHYASARVARGYDTRRFGGPGGRSVERREIETVLELLAGTEGLALDLPVGTGRLIRPLQSIGLQVLGLDYSLPMIVNGRRARGPFGAVVADAFETPFPAGCFDALILLRFFFHVSEPATLLAEVARLLRPGGHLVFDSLASSPRSRWPLLQNVAGGAVYPRGRAEVETLLSRHGFLIRKAISLFAFPSQLYRYLPGFAVRTFERIDQRTADQRRTKTFYLAWKSRSE
jgi:SAM-dependent methyltransferase